MPADFSTIRFARCSLSVVDSLESSSSRLIIALSISPLTAFTGMLVFFQPRSKRQYDRIRKLSRVKRIIRTQMACLRWFIPRRRSRKSNFSFSPVRTSSRASMTRMMGVQDSCQMDHHVFKHLLALGLAY
jgi:hypothetical protein